MTNLEALQQQCKRLIEENERLSGKKRWVSEYQQQILELQEQLAAKQVELDCALDKIYKGGKHDYQSWVLLVLWAQCASIQSPRYGGQTMAVALQTLQRQPCEQE